MGRPASRRTSPSAPARGASTSPRATRAASALPPRSSARNRERGGTPGRGTAPNFGLAGLGSRADGSCGQPPPRDRPDTAQDGHSATKPRPSNEGSSATRPRSPHEGHRYDRDGRAGGGVEEEVVARGDDHEENEDRIRGGDHLDESAPGEHPHGGRREDGEADVHARHRGERVVEARERVG